jgi:hypothetical protein
MLHMLYRKNKNMYQRLYLLFILSTLFSLLLLLFLFYLIFILLSLEFISSIIDFNKYVEQKYLFNLALLVLINPLFLFSYYDNCILYI